MTAYAHQLLRSVPAGFDRALTIDGLVSHGRKRFPNEWAAILADKTATQALFEVYFVQPRPDDGMRARMVERAMNAVADR